MKTKIDKYLNETTNTKSKKTVAIENLMTKHIFALLSNLDEIIYSDSVQWKKYKKDAMRLYTDLERFHKKIK